MVVNQGQEGGEMGRQGRKSQSCKKNKSKDLMYSMMPVNNIVLLVVNAIVLNTRNVPRVDFKCSHHTYTRKMVTM